MKRIQLIVAFIAASSFAFSQALQKAPTFETIKKADKSINSNNNNGTAKALGTTIWSSDFSAATEWTIGGNGAQGAWVLGTTASMPSPQYYTFIQSTTVANGIAYFTGIQFLLTGTVTSQNAWIEMTNSVNCSSDNIISFEFQQAYRAFNSDMTYVEVSLDDGVTWEQTTDINQNIAANSSTAETTVIRNFTVNQSTTVKFRFRWENTSTATTGSGYAWQIDDVKIAALSDHDIAITKHIYGSTTLGETLYYHQIPFSQTTGIESSAVLKNRGSQDQTNVVFTATESVNGIYIGSTAPVGILTNGEDSVAVTTNFTPSTIGDYQLDYSISYNNTDDYPLNNTVESYKFSVGEAIYARDSSTQTALGTVYGQTSGATMTPLNGMEAGNAFIMNQNANLTAIDFQFGNTINPGSLVYGQLYDDNLTVIPNSETAPYTMAIGDEGTHKTLKFDSAVNLIAGETYVVVVKSTSSDFSLATAGKSAPQTSFIYYLSDATWYYTTATPVVRMNFAPATLSSETSISGFDQLLGAPSPADSFNLEGFNLTGDITVTAPTNFEVSTTLAGPYSSSLTIANINGTAATTKVYIRLNGPIINLAQAGDIVISSAGAIDKLISLQGQTYDYLVSSIGSVTNTNANGEGTSVGDFVSLTGVLHCGNFSNSGYDLTLIDSNNDGISVYNITDLNGYVPLEGDEINVEGQIEQYYGLLQIVPSTITVLSQGAALQTPTIVNNINEVTESQFIELQGLNLINGEANWPNNGNVEVTNGTSTFRVRITATSPLAGTATPVGAFYLTGIGKQFDSSSPYYSGYQIFPCGVGPFCNTDVSVTVSGQTITANASGLSYQWIDCADSTEIAGETDQVFSGFGIDGSYAVIITDGACVDTSACNFVVGVGLNENEFSGVSVYPNPVQNVLKITNENGLLESVELVTAAGRIVYTSKISSTEFEINVAHISSGIYFVNVRSANSTKTFKVIK
ncbi:T9SS type A sorting domain-containing protein [Brumimicrobium glaciale]|uniref:T9SS type A sorting domain-containing protein n=1 Tax=Brumimicrobium glaciale TaxID=200475 RepID=A0A4Q4KGX8_9FLAO|nr:T9SS type A sorting domain-containing protein [Brumimicrobium glaciale]RYM32422.1 T9SS type A sorting domain-containing protein [Brumimicrobium glaciale]